MTLKPCPFCGKAPYVADQPPFVRIGCSSPGVDCVGPEANGVTLEEAAARWNRREGESP